MQVRDLRCRYQCRVARGQQQPEVALHLPKCLMSFHQIRLHHAAFIHDYGFPFNRLQVADVTG